MSHPNIELVAFDLGGVLIQLSGEPPITATAGENIWDRWLLSAAVRQFESGKCDADTFAQDLIAEFGLNTDSDNFLQRFSAWPGTLYPGAETLIAALQPRCQLASLSNTNPVHWQQFEEKHQLAAMFKFNLPSHQTGFLKPDANVFSHLIDVTGVAAQHILFLDDNQLNVEAAITAGLHAELTNGVTGASVHLKNYGLLA